MDTVLGLSMTPTTVGLVLVEGDGADSSTRGQDAFGVRRGGYSPVTTSAFVAEALSRTQAITHGQQLQSIRVTWSEDAATEASLLLESLADAGFDDVVTIRLPVATEAFARGIGEVIGSDVTAVCVIESDTAIMLVVNANDSDVSTATSGQLETEYDLIEWISDVMDRNGWQPDGLVLLGAAGELHTIAQDLQGILGLPVFAPAEAELALARGAALSQPARSPRRLWSMPAAPLALLVGGILTFVVSASMAIGIELLPNRGAAQVNQHIVNTAETPAMLPAPAAPAPLDAPAPAPEAELSTSDEAPLLPTTEAATMSVSAPELPAVDEPATPEATDTPVAVIDDNQPTG